MNTTEQPEDPRNDCPQGRIVGFERRASAVGRTPSRIPTVATMTSRMPLLARRRSLNSADTTRASAGCRVTTTSATPGSASVFKPSSTAGGASYDDGVLCVRADAGFSECRYGAHPVQSRFGESRLDFEVQNHRTGSKGSDDWSRL